MVFGDVEILVKLGITAVLGLIIGLERELKRKPLGLKTSLVISIISCLLTIVSIQSAYLFKHSEYVQITMDPLRLAAQIVSGIGFLGAGVILKKDNDTITGLTTAAMIWGASGIGIAVGAGFYPEAIAGVILIMISVEIIPFLLNMAAKSYLRNKDLLLKVTVHDSLAIDHVLEMIEQHHITIENVRIKDLEGHGHLIDLKVRTSYRQTATGVYHNISAIEDVTAVEVES
ncbi:MgtC/SapB family protein [Heyndrickxia acidiproducens]|uniref:MgtC/SapB family protein n=1 Tax=Heyndrickxia acidiproducens TaxID=1121084 RepID=UPI00036BE81C|nr:MgtC/SapB family protein [Heyndrickxia acidiproducens]